MLKLLPVITLIFITSCSGSSGTTKKPDQRTPVFRPRGAARTAILTDARVLGNSALLYYRKGQYAAAEKEYRKAVNKLILIDNYVEIGRIRINLSLIYIKQKKWKKADQTALSSVNIFRNHNLYPDLARALAMRGRIQEARKSFPKALTFYESALNLLRKYRGPAPVVAEQLANVAFAYYKLKKFTRALHYFKSSAGINNRIRNYSSLAQDYTYLGKCSLALKKTKTALRYFQNALTADRVTENPSGIALSHRNIAECFFLSGALNKAADHLTRAIRINSVLKKSGRIIVDLKKLITVYTKLGNRKKVRELRSFYYKLRKKIR